MILDFKDAFHCSGPSFSILPSPSSSHFKRVAFATLVKSVYVAERDRHLQRAFPLAPSWWSAVGFEPLSFVRDPGEHIIGATFRDRNNGHVVVAFRGTILQSPESVPTDMVANLYLLSLQLHKTRRFIVALDAIRAAIEQVGCENVSIAGHSLGAALAMLGGQALALENINVDTHLFNPPFPSPPIEYVKHRKSKLILNVLDVVCAASLSALLLDTSSREAAYASFFALKNWSPHLYVNAHDPVCSSYRGFFNSHEFLQSIGVGFVSKVAAPMSSTATIQRYLSGESKPFHLVPCAHLYVVDQKSRSTFSEAHGLHQWWSLELDLKYQERCIAPSLIT